MEWVGARREQLTVWEIPRSRYTHVTGRQRMSALVFACCFEWLRSGSELVIHFAQCGLDNQSAGVVRRIFFLLRHLSKFPSFKKKKIHRVVFEIWPWEFSLLHLTREVCLHTPEYAGAVWSGVVLLRRKPENPWSSKPDWRVPLYASTPAAYDGPLYARRCVLGGHVNVPRSRNFSDWLRPSSKANGTTLAKKKVKQPR